MPTIFRTNNPTKVLDIDKGAVLLRIIRDGEYRSFFIEKLEQDSIQLPKSVKIACIATAGPTVQYFEMGTLGKVDYGTYGLNEIGDGAAIRFRVIFYDPDSARILASADNVRSSEDQGPTPSLISIEPTSLGGPIWVLEMPADVGENQPTLLVEQRLFPFSQAVVTDKTFLAFVLPEVVRQIAMFIAKLDVAEDSDESWALSWLKFFRSMGISSFIGEEEDQNKWAEECVKAFCSRGNMHAILDNLIVGEGGISK